MGGERGKQGVVGGGAQGGAHDADQAVAGAGTQQVQAVLARGGKPSPQEVADILEANPGDRGAIVKLLQQTPGLGNAFVNDVIMHADSAMPHLAGDEKLPQMKARYLDGNFGTDPVDTLPRTTSAHQADVLNALRADSRRLNPPFVAELQQRLSVPQTGYLDVPTLQALLEHAPELEKFKDLKDAKQVHGAVAAILGNKGNWLAAGSATPVFVDAGVVKGTQAAKLVDRPKDGNRADRVAQGLGFPSYADYKATLHPSTTFLGVPLTGAGSDGRAHPVVVERLKVAETYLEQKFPNMPVEKIREQVGWHHGGNAAYGDTEDEIGKDGYGPQYALGAHMHSFGLAIDIDPSHNPYVFGGSKAMDAKDADRKTPIQIPHFFNSVMELHLRRAAQLYDGGEPLTAAKLYQWSQEMSTEELFARVDRAQQALAKYLAEPGKVQVGAALTETLKDKAAAKQQRKDRDAAKVAALAKLFVAKGYAHDEADKAAYDWLDFVEDGHDGRDASLWNNVSKGGQVLMTHGKELVIALRDVAGFSWGGVEMSDKENGDFMHFDLRNTSYGQAVVNHTQAAFNDAKRDEALAADPKNTDPDWPAPKKK